MAKPYMRVAIIGVQRDGSDGILYINPKLELQKGGDGDLEEDMAALEEYLRIAVHSYYESRPHLRKPLLLDDTEQGRRWAEETKPEYLKKLEAKKKRAPAVRAKKAEPTTRTKTLPQLRRELQDLKAANKRAYQSKSVTEAYLRDVSKIEAEMRKPLAR